MVLFMTSVPAVLIEALLILAARYAFSKLSVIAWKRLTFLSKSFNQS